jgi:hypothetical protein
VLAPPSNGGDTEENLSLDEKLRRERQRAYAVGITTYAWGAGKKILVPLQVGKEGVGWEDAGGHAVGGRDGRLRGGGVVIELAACF